MGHQRNPFGKSDPLFINEGDRARLQLMNMTRMTHCHNIYQADAGMVVAMN